MLHEIQAQVKAPKGQFNSFGKYKYRSCEDIVEAIKPIINPLGFWLILSDEVVEVGGRVYVKATATLTNGKLVYQAYGYAREEETKKGMDSSQVTGASSSYARKYALNGLFAIDDTKDSDATNEHNDFSKEKKELATLVMSAKLTPEQKESALKIVNDLSDISTYNKIKSRLKEAQ